MSSSRPVKTSRKYYQIQKLRGPQLNEKTWTTPQIRKMTTIFEVVRKTIIIKIFKNFSKRKKVRRALGLTDFAPTIFKVSATDIWFFGIWCETLVEVTVQNFRLLFLTETDLKSFSRNYDNARQWNKQTVVEHYRSVFHNNYETM